MNTTPDSAVEQLTIELPVSVVSAIRAEAMAQGRDAESIAADRLSNLYAVAANEPQSTSPFGTPRRHKRGAVRSRAPLRPGGDPQSDVRKVRCSRYVASF